MNSQSTSFVGQSTSLFASISGGEKVRKYAEVPDNICNDDTNYSSVDFTFSDDKNNIVSDTYECQSKNENEIDYDVMRDYDDIEDDND